MKKAVVSRLMLVLLLVASAASFAEARKPVATYPNLFVELLGKSDQEVRKKIEDVWNQLFYGSDDLQRVYYPVGKDMAYIMDIGSNDVRSEGMSYGMMIAVQLDKKKEFDALWKWTKSYMYRKEGRYQGYFAWHCTPEGKQINDNPASDGEEYFATALFFAAGRWGNGEGIFNYRKEAQAVLDTMLHSSAGGRDPGIDMFNQENKLILFVPSPDAASTITDPSYHLPHFYELWAAWADKDNEFWSEAATASRAFLKKAADPKTGLMADYTKFDGTPTDLNNGGHDAFGYDALRIGMNVAVDYAWFAADPWEVGQSNRLLGFFKEKGIYTYRNLYKVTGESLGGYSSLALISMNAVAALAATADYRKDFVNQLWRSSPPEGTWRYYDGMLYLLGLLNCSGQYRIYAPISG